jgi:hypothetical protein
MTLFENFVCRLHLSDSRWAFRSFTRRCLAASDSILLGFAGGCVLVGATPPHRLGIYEICVQRELARILKRGSIFYDVGANVGFSTFLGAEVDIEGSEFRGLRRARGLLSLHRAPVLDRRNS